MLRPPIAQYRVVHGPTAWRLRSQRPEALAQRNAMPTWPFDVAESCSRTARSRSPTSIEPLTISNPYNALDLALFARSL